MESGARTPADWETAYTSARGHHDDFTQALDRLVSDLLSGAGIDVAQQEARTKSAASYREKIERKKYVDPTTEVTDLVGIRVILYFQDDVDAVGKLIEREFNVDSDKSPRQGTDLPVDRFGYRSDHYVVKLSPQRLALSEYSRFDDCCGEIQVRTVMDHAWSAVDHQIRYKSDDLPEDLQRRLYRLKALLEVADEQFAALRDASGRKVKSYERSVSRGKLDVALDALSLQAYLSQTEIGRHWAMQSEAVGFGEASIDSNPPSLEAEWNAELLECLQKAQLTRLADFERLLRSADSWGEEALKVVGQKGHEAGLKQTPTLALLMITQIALKDPELVTDTTWLPRIEQGVLEAFRLSDFEV